MKHTLHLPLSLSTGNSMPALMLATGLGLVLAHPLAAKDLLAGTPGGAIMDDGFTFVNATAAEEFEGNGLLEPYASTNRGVQVSSTGSKWWGQDGADLFVPIDGDLYFAQPIVRDDKVGTIKEIMTHVAEPLSAGDTYWMSLSFYYPQSDYKGVIRGNQTGLKLPTGTELYIGLQFYDDGVTDYGDNFDPAQDITKTTSLAQLAGADHTKVPTAADDFDAAEIPGNITDWFNYEIDDDTASWEFLIEDSKDGLDSLLMNWVVGVVLPAGFGGSTYNEFDDIVAGGVDGNSNPIAAGSEDIFFRWTVDEKGFPVDDPDSPYNDPTDPLFVPGGLPPNEDFGDPFEVTVVPEPASTSLLMLGALGLIMRRKRS